MNMLRTVDDFCGRIVGQPIVPSVQSGVAAADRIILIAPGVVAIRQLVQCRDGRAHILIFKSLFVYCRRRFRDQRLVRDIGIPLRRGLCAAGARTDNEQNESDKEKIDQLHRANSIAWRRIGKRKERRFQSVSLSSAWSWRRKSWRADFLIARRSAATACFSAWRSRLDRVSTELGKCEIF